MLPNLHVYPTRCIITIQVRCWVEEIKSVGENERQNREREEGEREIEIIGD